MTIRSTIKAAVAGAVISLTLAQVASAADFATADRLFSQRENNKAVIAQARS